MDSNKDLQKANENNEVGEGMLPKDKVSEDKVSEDKVPEDKASEDIESEETETEGTDAVSERLELAYDRIHEIAMGEAMELLDDQMADYFAKTASFLVKIEEISEGLEKAEECGDAKQKMDLLAEQNRKLYEGILPENYGTCYGNPTFANEKLGEEFGGILSALYAELHSLIGYAFEKRNEDVVIRLELFLEIYSAFVYEWQESKKRPEAKNILETLYWYASDYAEVAALERTRELVSGEDTFAVQIVMESDLSDPAYLYKYGEYVTENEIKTAQFLASLPEETIAKMADTYTEGYRIGFEVTGKDLSKKKVVDIRYRLGFERMIKKAIENFAKMGLKPAIYRNPYSLLHHPSIFKTGYYGAEANRQYDFDHKDDKALFLDKNYINRRLEVSQAAFEQYKEEARAYAGPAVVETFGEVSFEPEFKKDCLHMSEEQNKLWVEYRSKAGRLQQKYIIEEERSFTIIAFPVPEIGANFEEVFAETVRINTLDYKLYQQIQQTLIDALDKADHCVIRGENGNKTDLTVNLWKLKDPAKETIFENCVADVNIPVGEVFTSPVLKGTNGVLHVKKVYLNGLEFRDLKITFEDGMIASYDCGNFDNEEENKKFIFENILFRQKTLPIGEFAIGTNTTAYVATKRLGIGDKMPILIAEKMGPHFAVGDTCYSHAEEVKVYNPDGKEIVARENEVAAKRDEDPANAYFNCHTDITIPYDELGALDAVTLKGEVIPIIRQGRFVLPGTEKLNEPFE